MRSHHDPEAIYDRIIDDPLIADLLGRLKDHDGPTYEHSLVVAKRALRLGYALDVDADELVQLGYGAILHDIGKLFVPSHILTKRGPLTSAERALIREHPRRGFELAHAAHDTIRTLIVAHHEYQRDPYPRHSERSAQGLDRRRPAHSHLVEILSLADLYSALAEPRSYHDARDRAAVRPVLEREFSGNHRYVEAILRSEHADERMGEGATEQSGSRVAQ